VYDIAAHIDFYFAYTIF